MRARIILLPFPHTQLHLKSYDGVLVGWNWNFSACHSKPFTTQPPPCFQFIPYYSLLCRTLPPPGVLITPQHTHPAFSHLCLFAQAAPWASDAIPPLQSTWQTPVYFSRSISPRVLENTWISRRQEQAWDGIYYVSSRLCRSLLTSVYSALTLHTPEQFVQLGLQPTAHTVCHLLGPALANWSTQGKRQYVYIKKCPSTCSSLNCLLLALHFCT